MKNVLEISAVSIFLLFVANLAHAQWYVGGGLSQTESDQSVGFDVRSQTETDDSSDLGGKLFAGYRFSPNLSIELGRSVGLTTLMDRKFG